MKAKYRIVIACLSVLIVVSYFNWKYEVIAINTFGGEEKCELKIMTWNVHCSEGSDNERQRKIAELILKENVDFVQLNEYNQDSCSVVDSLLKAKYYYTEESRSHRKCGDIFYSKYAIFNSGRIDAPVKGETILAIKAIIVIGVDSVRIFGIHMASNQYNDGEEDHQVLEIDYRSAYNRYKEAQKLRCRQAEWTRTEMMKSIHPIIVMGDMNDFNKSKPLMILRSCGLKDSWWEGGNGYGATFHDGMMRLRIDHVLHSDKLKLQNIKVIDTNLSDHNPVVAGFCVNKR